MAITVDYSTAPFLITVPQSDLSLITGTQYQLTVDTFWSLLSDFTDNEQVMAQPVLYSRIPATSSTPSITEIDLDFYRIEFEDGLYSVNIINGNTNIREAEVKNQVSVNTNNTTGFINPVFLESALFQGYVSVDVSSGVSGTGYTSSGAVIGTEQARVDNMTDALAIAIERGLVKFLFHSDITLSTLDLSAGYNFEASSPSKLIICNASAIVDNCSFKQMQLTGELDGFNLAERALLFDCTDLVGFCEAVSFLGNNTVTGAIQLINCLSGETGTSRPSFDIGVNSFQTVKWSKSIEIRGALAGNVSSIELQGGTIYIDSSCVGGDIYIRGTPFGIVDNSAAGCTVHDQTESEKVNNIHQAHFNRRHHDQTANTITIYDADNTTPLHVFDADDALTDITPQ